MKKKHLLLPALLFISLLSTALFCSCDKDTNSYLDVLVLDETTRNPISGVEIHISQDRGEVVADGVTGADGIFSTHFTKPAILTVDALLRLDGGGKRKGQTTVRVKDGETITATITLPAQVVFN